MKAHKLFLLSLLPFPILSYEFLPTHIILFYIGLIILRFFTLIPKIILFPISAYILYMLKMSFENFFLPEPMISFLALMCLLRILDKDKSDYKINRILGLMWIGSFALFKTDLLYLIFMLFSLYLNFKILAYNDNQTIKLSSLFKIKSMNFKEICLSLLLISILFVFFPRFYGFLPRVNSPQQGQIGYSKTIDNSKITNLQFSSKNAFTVELEKMIPITELYWRGRVHSKTDGYNWKSETLVYSKLKLSSAPLLSYQMKYEQDLAGDIVLLDTPGKISSSSLAYTLDNETNTYSTYLKNRKIIVNARSSLQGKQTNINKLNKNKYLKLPKFLPEAFRVYLRDLKLNKKIELNTIIKRFKMYLKKEKFTYALNPGDVTSLSKFLKVKKGFCTHYASLLGLTFRNFGFPTRLVSGFQGGEYNELGGFYTISSNDAHAWVEVYTENNWIRVDPTAFVEPDRLNYGGEAFFTENQDQLRDRNSNSNFILYLKKSYGMINYKMSLWLDSFDQDKQESISKNLSLNKNAFFIIGFILIIFLLFLFYILRRKLAPSLSLHDQLLQKLINHLNRKYSAQIEAYDSIEAIKLKAALYKDISSFMDIYEQIKYNQQMDQKHIKELKLQLQIILSK